MSYTTDLKQQVDDMLGALDIVIVVLTISAGMLAFVVLYNLNNINITERKRELATLKVLGFTRSFGVCISGKYRTYGFRRSFLASLSERYFIALSLSLSR